MRNTTKHTGNQIYRDFFQLIKRPNAQLIQDEQSATSYILFTEPDELKQDEHSTYLHSLTKQHFDISDAELTISHIPNAIIITIEH